ncbi:hypothetical protein IQ63_18375 [Streptomyces acidiscabies]|uniref:UvrABC system protein A n=1 Tax=Streptomyces acidiscabies TaxID=42234 RepID=A0A0L0K7D6_9ACTN|nr:hypothetical protein IQ63_18375 [Streptomyces acidiscabies]
MELPNNALTVFTRVSGSGKSSLTVDSIFAERKRRYVKQLEKPDTDAIEGLSLAIAIDQKTSSRDPRSTAGAITEVYDHLGKLFVQAAPEPVAPHPTSPTGRFPCSLPEAS